jgi:hypothetical protein
MGAPRRRGERVVNKFEGSAHTVVQAGTIRELHVYGVLHVQLRPISAWAAVSSGVVVVALAVAGAWLLRTGMGGGPGIASLLAVAGGATVLASAYALGHVTWRRWQLSHRRYEDVLRHRVDAATTALARAQQIQWRREERLRRLADPGPLAVRWTAADPLHTDHWVNIRADGRDDPLDLDGAITEITDVFARVPSGRLAVLGTAGAGKSIVALRFVLDTLEHHSPGEPVPVLLSLPTWNPTDRGLWDWVADRMATEHPELAEPSGVGSRIADELATPERLLLVLDGLDEMPPAWRTEALQGMNEAMGRNGRMLLTCRTAEYRAAVDAADVLTAAAAVQLQPLRYADLADYLTRTTRKRGADGSTKWAPVLARIRDRPDDPAARTLRRVLATPLMVALARTGYSDTAADPVDLLDATRFPDPTSVENHLIDRLIPAVYTESPDSSARRRWDATDAYRWLTLLARDAAVHSSGGELTWWTYQATTARWIATGVVVAVYLAVLGVVYSQGFNQPIDASPFGQVPVYLVYAVIGLPTLAIALFVAWARVPVPVRLQFRQRRRSLALRTVVGGAASAVVWRFLEVPIPVAVAFAIIVVLRAAPGTATTVSVVPGPGTLLRADRTAALVLGVPHLVLGGWQRWFFAVFVLGPLTTIAEWQQHIGHGTITAVTWTITITLLVVIAFCYGVADTSSGRFALVRLAFAARGNLPWRLMDFLDDAHRRGVLRQYGGVYRFRHASLHTRLAGDVQPRKPSAPILVANFAGPVVFAAVLSFLIGFQIINNGITYAKGQPGPYLTVPDACTLTDPATRVFALPGLPSDAPPSYRMDSFAGATYCTFNTDDASLTIAVDVAPPTTSTNAVQTAEQWFRGDYTHLDHVNGSVWKPVHLRPSDATCDWDSAVASFSADDEERTAVRCQNIIFTITYSNQGAPEAQAADIAQRVLRIVVHTAVGD